MTFKKIISATIGAGLLAAANLAGAATVTVTVDALENSTSGGTALDSRIHLDAGEGFRLFVDPNQTWNFDGGNPQYTVNANGYAGFSETLWNNDGSYLQAPTGSLVGRIGSGNFFFVGTEYAGHADTSGNLLFYFVDSDSWNNIGQIDAVFVFPSGGPVSPVPEPSSVAMASVGLLAFGARMFARRRRAKGGVPAV